MIERPLNPFDINAAIFEFSPHGNSILPLYLGPGRANLGDYIPCYTTSLQLFIVVGFFDGTPLGFVLGENSLGNGIKIARDRGDDFRFSAHVLYAIILTCKIRYSCVLLPLTLLHLAQSSCKFSSTSAPPLLFGTM